MKKAMAAAVVLFITMLVIVFTFTSPITTFDVALAQQQVQSALPTAAGTDTPEAFRPLLKKWSFADPVRLEITAVDKDGNVTLKYIGKSGRIIDNMSGMAFVESGGTLRLKLAGGTMSRLEWDLRYIPSKDGGVLRGAARTGGFTGDEKVFFPVK